MEKEKEYKKDLGRLTARMQNMRRLFKSLIGEFEVVDAIKDRMIRNVTPEYDWRKDPTLSVNKKGSS